MKLPIAYALSYPKRLQSITKRLDFFNCPPLTFEKPDTEKFRNLAFAFDAVRQGGNMPCILNAANEIAVSSFLQEQIGFLQISDIIEQCLSDGVFIARPTYEDYVRTDVETRRIAEEHIKFFRS